VSDAGTGFGAYRDLTACNFNNDGHKDLVGITPAGQLVRWSAAGQGWTLVG
jgi:hypothetical protein